MVSKPEQIADPIETFDYCDAEIVIGLVCAVGTDYGPIRDSLKDILARYGYKCRVVRISDSIPKSQIIPSAVTRFRSTLPPMLRRSQRVTFL